MALVWTDLGKTWWNNLASGGSNEITEVRVGTFPTGQRYTATETRRPIDTSPVVFPVGEPIPTGAKSRLVLNLGPTTNQLVADEIYIYSGSTPIIAEARSTGPIFTKEAADTHLYIIQWEVTTGNAPLLEDIETVVMVPPLATEAQARAGTDNTRMMTPLRTEQAIAERGGGGLNIQTFNSSGTWTKPDGAKIIEIFGWNGGQAGHSSQGGSGGAAFYAKLLASEVPNTVSVTISAGGASNGAFGGKSTFGGGTDTGGVSTLQRENSNYGWALVRDSNSYMLGRGFRPLGARGGDSGSPFLPVGDNESSGVGGSFGSGAGGASGNPGERPGGGGGLGVGGAPGRIVVVTYF